MYLAFFIGIWITLAFAALALVGFFVRAWRVEPNDRTYLLFSLAMLVQGIHTFAVVGTLAAGLGWNAPSGWAHLATLTSHLGSALWVHFALLYASVHRPWRYAASTYTLLVVLAFLSVVGCDTYPRTILFAGGLGTLAMVARRWAQTGDGLGVVAGTAAFVATTARDMAVDQAECVPMGAIVLGFAAALTFVGRYGVASFELERSTRELQRRSKALEASYRELKRTQLQLVRSEQLAVVGELSAVIAHEVRNPLAIVSNAVASLHKKQTRGSDRKTLLNIISEEMGRLDQLVSRLVHYARPIVPARDPLDLTALVERALVLAEGRQTEVDIAGGAQIVGDASLLRQAFDNVVQNAVQATMAGGRLRVDIIEGGERMAVAFTDDGEGMDLDSQAQALSPFFTTRPTGTGLGLPIVSRIAEAHGGHLSIDSKPGEGTTVTLHLAKKGPPRRAKAKARSWP